MRFADVISKHGFHPEGILHVGACMLEEADDYQQMGVKKVIWIEALRPDQNREKRALQFGHRLFEGMALSDKDGESEFREVSNGVSGSILPLKRHSELYPDVVVTNRIIVQTHRADTLFVNGDLDGIDTLVLDVQGAELLVLKGMGDLLARFRMVYAEVNLNELYEGCALQPELERWMADRGFSEKEFFPVHAGEWGEEAFFRK